MKSIPTKSVPDTCKDQKPHPDIGINFQPPDYIPPIRKPNFQVVTSQDRANDLPDTWKDRFYTAARDIWIGENSKSTYEVLLGAKLAGTLTVEFALSILTDDYWIEIICDYCSASVRKAIFIESADCCAEACMCFNCIAGLGEFTASHKL